MARQKTLRWPVRGIMADPARLMERHEFYFELVEWMAEWGLNTLWWHFTDDEGFMVRLESHPELASPHAFSKAEMGRLLARADECGIDVVPEVESLGHARAITSLRQHAELADGGEVGFNAMCPSHKRTLPLLGEIITEVAALFPGRYFHAGMDEVDLGDCPRCRRRGRGRPKWWVYARHVRAIHEIVAAAGKEMIIWADHVEKDPGMLKVLPKDIIMAHWQYREIRPAAFRRSLRAGFRVIGCPALCHWGDMIMPNAGNFENMDSMTAALGGVRPRRQVLGLVNTWWTLWRGLRDAYLPAVAYTGEMIRVGSAVGKAAFMRRFARERFALTGKSAGDALWALTEAMPTQSEVSAALFDSPTDILSAAALAGHGTLTRRKGKLAAAVAVLEAAGGKVAAQRRREFRAVLLAGQVGLLCCEQVERLGEAVEHYRRAEQMHETGRKARHTAGELRLALTILRHMRRQVARAARAVEREWDRTRYADDPKKGAFAGRRYSRDALLPKLQRSARFLERLAAGLGRAIGRYVKGGAFPLGL